MKIDLGKFYIESDRNQFILYEIRKKGMFPGRPNDIPDENDTVNEIVGYYSSLAECFKSMPDRAIMRSDITTLSDCLKEIKLYKQMIKEAMG
jgi:hypothetical protein